MYRALLDSLDAGTKLRIAPRRCGKHRAHLQLEELEGRLTPSVVAASSFFDSALYEFDSATGALKATLVAPNSSSLLAGPAGLAIGPDRNLYISSQFNDSILEYNISSNTLATFISTTALKPIATANGDAQFAPAGLAFGPDGNLYVSLNGGQTAASGGAVIRFNVTANAGALTYGGTSAVVATGLIQPTALTFGTAAGETDSLYVSNSAAGDVIKVAKATGTSPNSSTFVAPGKVAYPAGLTWGGDGKLYVVDLAATTFQGNVVQFNTDGSFSKIVTPTGQGQPGNLLLQFPSSIVFDGQGHFLTANLGSAIPPNLAGSINQYNTDGTFSQVLVSSSQFPSTGQGTSGIAPSQLALLQPLGPQFAISTPASVTAGSPFSVTVTAQDASGATMTSYAGTVHFTKSDTGPGAGLPADYTFTAADKGVHVFTNTLTLVSAGSQTVTATDNASVINGTAILPVTPAATNHFKVAAPSSAGLGASFNFTVTALDPYNNPTGSGYTGSVKFSSTDSAASLPASATLTGGTGAFTATLKSAGSQTITATDTAFAGITGTSDPVSVGVAATQFAITAPSTVTAGSPFLVTVAAEDSSGNPAAYNGTVPIASTDPQAVLPTSATLTNGLGAFLVTLKTVSGGPWVIKAQNSAQPPVVGSSNQITVTPGPASYFTALAPTGTQTTGIPFNVTVTALDTSGNVATAYSGKVHFTSSDPAAVVPADSTLTTGQGVFAVTLKTAGSQTIKATDSVSTNPTITGTTAAILTRGLTVTSFTPTPTGFTATFSKAFVPADLTLYGPGLSTPQDVTLVGKVNGPITGTLIVDPQNTSITFKATANSLSLINNFTSVVLPDDVYTATLVSGSGSNGFLDALGAGLDGGNNAGHANYLATFTTTYQTSATPVLAVPDFARGPDETSPIKVPNDSAKGIPITLYNASKVTDVAFSLSYNPSLLNISAASNGDATDTKSSLALVAVTTNPDGLHATAAFHYQGPTPESGTVVLGDIVATVPKSAAANYKAKELIQVAGVTVNQNAALAVAGASGVHVNAYFGDVTGNGTIDGLGVATAGLVGQGKATGFPAYQLLDPAVVGDVALDYSVDAGDISDLAAFTVHLPIAVIPAIPTGLTITPVGADPTLSLASGESRVASDESNFSLAPRPSPLATLSVPVLLDDPHPVGSTGMVQAVLALTYDPSALGISAKDITLGSMAGLDVGWQIESRIDSQAGYIGIDLFGTTAITASDPGSLVNITFHVLPGAKTALTTVQLVDRVLIGDAEFTTQVDDAQGRFVLSPGVDHVALPTSSAAAPSADTNKTHSPGPRASVIGTSLARATVRAVPAGPRNNETPQVPGDFWSQVFAAVENAWDGLDR